ncbi:T9SS type A sorting domain-containing protein [Aquimarina sp. SS2-1]|uniref:T9SS type A sorting domain-containing protein n=1 Tax=Aquimarina besae TaxID=3342247 RepID=UPI00366D2334
MRSFHLFTCLLLFLATQAQVTLNADGIDNTYELITSVLAPGYNPIESPGEIDGTCDNHSSFGRHISEVFDNELNDYVFKFNIHVSEDNDRCKNFDRQRNEIKSYSQSPDNLKGTIGETVEYKWKFKLDAAFQASSKFTHLHQLKSVGADAAEESQPLITLTARKGNPDKLELRYAPTTSQSTLTSVNLSSLKGNWVEVTETVTYGETNNATYSINITNINTGAEILNYSSSELRMWKTNADFIRPKWGIYRSLVNDSDLRDEEVLFANFSITENPQLSVPSVSKDDLFSVFPNPTKGIVHFNFRENIKTYNVSILDSSGKVIREISEIDNNKIDIKNLSDGTYFIKLTDSITNTYTVKQMVKAN